MAQIIVRDLDDEVLDRLKERAKAHDRSIGAEAREILTTTVMSVPDDSGAGLGTRIAELFGGEGIEVPARDWLDRSVRPASFDD